MEKVESLLTESASGLSELLHKVTREAVEATEKDLKEKLAGNFQEATCALEAQVAELTKAIARLTSGIPGVSRAAGCRSPPARLAKAAAAVPAVVPSSTSSSSRCTSSNYNHHLVLFRAATRFPLQRLQQQQQQCS
jgi:hypothetical protein